jgi:hypothetical protein
VRAVLLQHLYPSLYDLLVRKDSGSDPIGMFLDYVEFRERATEPPVDDPNDPWWVAMQRIFEARKLAPKFPDASMGAEIERLESELPADFSSLARDDDCINLLRGIGDAEARQALRAQLMHRPLATAQIDAGSALLSSFGTISEAVSAAIREGYAFGEAVARTSPHAWVAEILAKKPQMPTGLEQRLLRRADIPIDSPFNDEIQNALCQGFWDALENLRV